MPREQRPADRDSEETVVKALIGGQDRRRLGKFRRRSEPRHDLGVLPKEHLCSGEADVGENDDCCKAEGNDAHRRCSRQMFAWEKWGQLPRLGQRQVMRENGTCPILPSPLPDGGRRAAPQRSSASGQSQPSARHMIRSRFVFWRRRPVRAPRPARRVNSDACAPPIRVRREPGRRRSMARTSPEAE